MHDVINWSLHVLILKAVESHCPYTLYTQGILIFHKQTLLAMVDKQDSVPRILTLTISVCFRIVG